MKNEILPDSAIEIKGLSKEYKGVGGTGNLPVSYTHLRAHET